MKQKKTRIRNANKFLPFFLKENESFHVGLLFEDFLKNGNLQKYGFPTNFSEGIKLIPAPIGPTTKANIQGKYVRKSPEEKVDKKVHIDYFRRKDGAHIAYDRYYHVYVKELVHKFNMALHLKTNKHGQRVVVSEPLIYNNDPSNIMKNTHIMNLFYEICRDCEIFNADLEPAIHFNKRFEIELLPHGSLSDKKIQDELLHFASRYTKNEEEQKAFQKRLHILMNYNPDLRGKGPNNFFGYLVFGFTNFNIVILETMYSGNATYVFRMQDYEQNVIQDKQSVLDNKLMIRRFYHHDDWEAKITSYLDNLKGLKS